MNRYLDIRILPDPEFAPNHLMNALFAKLHRCLVRTGVDDVGISFPEVDPVKPHLGRVLRLHGTEDSFARLLSEEWLTGMRDHVQISGVQAVPGQVEHRRVRRVQVKSSPERIRRRQIKRHQWTAEEAKKRIPDSSARMLPLPFLSIQSISSGRRFNLFIDQERAERPVAGSFNAYGLSASATVPWF
jgi:CRISPR-associated endonuclease Csy4